MNDDFNTALTIGHLFNIVKKINAIHTGQLNPESLGKETFDRMKSTFLSFAQEVLGLKPENALPSGKLLSIILKEYAKAKSEKNYEKVDELRAELKAQGIVVKDMKTGVDWAYEE